MPRVFEWDKPREEWGGLTAHQRNDMLWGQKGRCACCRQQKPHPILDRPITYYITPQGVHSRILGKPRGFVCRQCWMRLHNTQPRFWVKYEDGEWLGKVRRYLGLRRGVANRLARSPHLQ